MTPSQDGFIYDLQYYPLFITRPSQTDKSLFDRGLNRLVRRYYKLLRSETRSLSHQSVIHSQTGIVTCGELAMIILRRDNLRRKLTSSRPTRKKNLDGDSGDDVRFYT